MRWILLGREELMALRASERGEEMFAELEELAREAMETPPVYDGHLPINRRALSWYFGKIGALALVGLLKDEKEKITRVKELIRILHMIARGSRTALNTGAGRLSVEPIQESILCPELLLVEHVLEEFGFLEEVDRSWLEDLYKWMFPFALIGFTEIQLDGVPGNNHVLLDASSAGLLALRLRQKLPLWRKWAGFCNQQVLKYARLAILEDGGQMEGSPSYHTLVVTRLLLHVLMVRDLMGVDLLHHRGLLEKLKAAVDWVIQVATPDGRLPALNDSKRNFDSQFLFRAAALLTGEGKYTSALTTFPPLRGRTLPFGFILSGRDFPQPSRLPSSNGPLLLPKTGFAVIRDGLGGYLVCKSDPRWLWHTHDERCSFEWWPFGIPAAKDPGMVDYQRLEHFSYFRLPHSHNTVARYRPHKETVRPQDHVFPNIEISHDPYPREPGDIALVKNGVRMMAKISDSVKLVRIIKYGKDLGSLEVEDELIGADSHPYDWLFHGRGSLRVDGTRFAFEGQELCVRGEAKVPEGVQIVVLHGAAEPEGPDVPYIALRANSSPTRFRVRLQAIKRV